MININQFQKIEKYNIIFKLYHIKRKVMESKISNWSDVTFIPKEVKINVMAENISTKEIQIIMAKDSVMKEHKAPFPIHVQVLKGEIDFEVFGVKKVSHTLKALDMISLESNVPHSLSAKEDSIVRLSLAKADSAARVNAVLKK